MIDIVLAMLLQASQPAPAENAKPAAEEPKVVCTMEPVTGTRAKKQKVCKTLGYEKGSAAHQQMIDAVQRASNGAPPPDISMNRPGGPGF